MSQTADARSEPAPENGAAFSPSDGGDLLALMVQVAREQGRSMARQEMAERQLTAQEQRLAEFERTAAVRINELTKANDDLRETLVLANELLHEILEVCRRYGWTESSGVVALRWLDHVLSLGTVSGWPSVN